MGYILKRCMQLIIIAISFIGMKYAIKMHRKNTLPASPSQQSTQLITGNLQNQPVSPVTITTKQEAISQAGEIVKNSPNNKVRRDNAAVAFFGFYFVNTRSRVDFCNEQGTTIQLFSDAFKRNHVKELDVARSIIAESHMNEEQIYSLTKVQLRSALDADMHDIATSGGTNAKGACELIVAKAELLADTLQLSKVQPAVYQALMSDQ